MGKHEESRTIVDLRNKLAEATDYRRGYIAGLEKALEITNLGLTDCSSFKYHFKKVLISNVDMVKGWIKDEIKDKNE